MASTRNWGSTCAAAEWAAGNGNEDVGNDGYASYAQVIAVAGCNDQGGKERLQRLRRGRLVLLSVEQRRALPHTRDLDHRSQRHRGLQPGRSDARRRGRSLHELVRGNVELVPRRCGSDRPGPRPQSRARLARGEVAPARRLRSDRRGRWRLRRRGPQRPLWLRSPQRQGSGRKRRSARPPRRPCVHAGAESRCAICSVAPTSANSRRASWSSRSERS
jgi:hypothetical protein